MNIKLQKRRNKQVSVCGYRIYCTITQMEALIFIVTAIYFIVLFASILHFKNTYSFCSFELMFKKCEISIPISISKFIIKNKKC